MKSFKRTFFFFCNKATHWHAKCSNQTASVKSLRYQFPNTYYGNSLAAAHCATHTSSCQTCCEPNVKQTKYSMTMCIEFGEARGSGSIRGFDGHASNILQSWHLEPALHERQCSSAFPFCYSMQQLQFICCIFGAITLAQTIAATFGRPKPKGTNVPP